MAVSSFSFSSATLSRRVYLSLKPSCSTCSGPTIIASSRDASTDEERSGNCKRRSLLIGVGASSLLPTKLLLAQEKPPNYEEFVDLQDGYSYLYPSDWREFDFRGHDSAFKDRYLQLQNVRLSFIPTTKTDIHEMGPIDKVVANLVRHVYSTPTQVPDVFDMQERTTDGKNYYTFEYTLTSPNFSRAAFATIAVGNGRYYTLIVGANERRWRRFRNQLKVVADSFKVLDI
ncbi:photosynthetic NDH subunit of lumenal location 1, chloroplastic-like [Bidens hawaiensis]|uniref:photosynthetic NDH subunit of lumenal location 1, chloroplastic-like n=1 Tax=Bidens hawaiensis TaxID=980011 RepID=UPI00404B657E